MKPTENAEIVLKTRYYKENEDWNGLCRRVVRAISQPNPELEDEYYWLLNDFWFLPNSPTLMNAGTEIGNTAACFVLDISDSMDSIMETAKDMATIFRAGGGVGVDMSNLRENGSKVKKTQGVASGAVSFMEIYDTVARVTKQGGVRRAALMGVLRVDHPEILDFITCKNDRTRFNNFNLSVGITDKFMEAVANDKHYDLISPVNGRTGSLRARDVFDFIALNAHKHGEPGLLFLDTINKLNPIPQFGKISATNPCAEQPLLPNAACILGSINLSKISNISELDKLVRISIRFLNNAIDVSNYPLEKINQTVRSLRQIGLGIMGWADYLAKRDIAYDSQRAIDEADHIMSIIKIIAQDESMRIAQERDTWIKTTQGERYNGGLLSIAPTGTISMLADCSSSIEPYFALAYHKNVLDGQSLPYFNKLLRDKLIEHNLWTPEIQEKILETGSIQSIPEIPDIIKQVFKTANEIPVEAHIKMQAAFQVHIDSGISKTINLPNNATVKDVKDAYLLAYQMDCKGITVYRDGSRNGQVLTTNSTKSETCPECSQETVLEAGCRSCKHCGWSACSIA